MDAMNRIGKAAWVVVRLALFGSTGFIILLYGSVGIATYIEWIMYPDDPYSPSPFLSLPIMTCGAFLMLYAAGQWKHWAYLWVFMSLPISLLVLLLLSVPFPVMAGECPAVFFFAIVALSADLIVKKYYAREAVAQVEETANPWHYRY